MVESFKISPPKSARAKCRWLPAEIDPDHMPKVRVDGDTPATIFVHHQLLPLERPKLGFDRGGPESDGPREPGKRDLALG